MYGMSKFVIVVVVYAASIFVESLCDDAMTTIPTMTIYDQCSLEIGCECVDLGRVNGVICHNVTDFEALTQKLKNTSVFGPDASNAYEITLTGIRSIPANVFQGLNISRLILDDPSIEAISNDAFNAVVRLKRFRIQTSSVRKLPNFRHVATTLEDLNIDNSQLTTIGLEIQNMSVLDQVTFINNSIRTIDEKAFIGVPEVRTLDLSRNLLTFLPPHLLDGLKSLRMLSLSFNQLLTVKGLLAVVRPQFILLDHNNLTNVDEILVDNMTEVETVMLNNNPLRSISVNTFNYRIPNVRFIFLDNCLLQEFSFQNIKELPELNIIDLSYNFIEHVPKGEIGKRSTLADFVAKLEIYLNDNRISSFEAEITFAVTRLFMSGNRMQRLGSVFQLSQLTEVEIDRNQLEAILETDLRGMHGTENLSFRQNVISRIDRRAFFDVRNDLQTLDLSVNDLRDLNGSINYLSRLMSLNISYNDIQFFHKDEFIGLNELTELYMQHNKIKVLQGQLQAIPRLCYLLMQNNMVTNVAVQQIPSSLKFLYYKENPIVCDCSFLPFLKWLSQSDSPPTTDIDYCRTGNNSESINSSHSSSVLVFARKAEFCPLACSCSCSRDANDTFVSVDCNSRDITEPPDVFRDKGSMDTPADFLQNSSLVMWQNTDLQYSISDRVLMVNLEDNSITSLENWTFPRDLKDLRLADNLLSKMPSSVESLPVLRSLSLSHNPWSCVCEAVSFKKWLLSKMDGVVDVNNTRCAPDAKHPNLNGKLLINLSDVDLCPVAIGLYVSVAFSVLSALLFVAGLKILHSRYELHVKVWLYAHGITWVKEKDLDQDKKFDAFIAFSGDDDDLVKNRVVPEIEARLPNIQLCLHYKHFPLAEYIHTNIINAVQYSKRTVVILTKSFLESGWCLFEFETAHNQGLNDKVQRIIVVKAGELPDPKEVDPRIRPYLESITYVTWGEKYFWEKFKYALPTPDVKDKGLLCPFSNSTSSLI